MNGARALLSTLVDAGVDVCFANPGTSEMHFVAALDDVPAMRGHPVPVRRRGHRCRRRLRPGRRPSRGDVAAPRARPRQRVGQPAQRPPGAHAGCQHRGRPRHVPRPLRRAVAVGHRLHRQRRCRAGTARPPAPTTSAADAADAVAAAMGPPGCVATLVLPADASWSESSTGPCPPRPVGRRTVVPADTVEEVAKALRSGERTALLLGGSALRADGSARRQPRRRHDRGRAAGRDLPGQPRARRGHPGRRAARLLRRDGAGPARRRAPPDPRRHDIARLVLRLPGQSQRPGPRRLHGAHARPRRARTQPALSRP